MDMKKILETLDKKSSTPPEGVSDMKRFTEIVNEGANPHKVSLPVQMAMQHYQQSGKTETPRETPKDDSVLKKYFIEAEDIFAQKELERKEQLKMYARKLADKIMENRNQEN